MDNTIKSMFEEKNMKILINKLILDIDNNSNSLELTIKLKIPHLKYKLIKKQTRNYMSLFFYSYLSKPGNISCFTTGS